MKRSEMLKIIEGLFNIASGFPNELNAENLLATLENAGMRPPECITEVETEGYWDSEGSYWSGEKVKVKLRSWEPEG